MLLALKHPEVVERLMVVDILPAPTDDSTSSFKRYIEAMRGLDFSKITKRKEADAALQDAVRVRLA